MGITAKSVILDIADNWGNTSFLGLRSVDFWYGGSKISLAAADFTAYATSQYFASYSPGNVFDTSVSKTGAIADNEWYSANGSIANQRLIVVFDSSQTFDEIRINNSHSYGGLTDRGVKNVVIHYSTDSITDTTYNASISNSMELFDGQFDEHTLSDVEDEQNIDFGFVQLTDSTYIASSGTTVTTAQLTPPTGKTTEDFQAGRVSDDINPLPSLDLADQKYTELEFLIELRSDISIGNEIELRITKSGAPLNVYSSIPKITVSVASLEQFGFRFYQDDAVMTPLAANNTDITLSPDTNFILRTGIDAVENPSAKNFQLEYRRKPSGGVFADWVKVP